MCLLLSNLHLANFTPFYLNDWLEHYCSSKPRSAYSHHFGNNPTSRFFLITRTLLEVQTLFEALLSNLTRSLNDSFSPSAEAWLSFWSEVHYNSLYSRGGKKTQSLSSLVISKQLLWISISYFPKLVVVLGLADVPTRKPRRKHWLF